MKINFTYFANLFLLMSDIFPPWFWFVVVKSLDFLVFQCLTFASDVLAEIWLWPVEKQLRPIICVMFW